MAPTYGTVDDRGEQFSCGCPCAIFPDWMGPARLRSQEDRRYPGTRPITWNRGLEAGGRNEALGNQRAVPNHSELSEESWLIKLQYAIIVFGPKVRFVPEVEAIVSRCIGSFGPRLTVMYVTVRTVTGLGPTERHRSQTHLAGARVGLASPTAGNTWNRRHPPH